MLPGNLVDADKTVSASYKRLFARAFTAAPRRLHFAAHSHHLWPDASYDGHLEAWTDAAALADRKWDKIFDAVIPEAQRHIASELKLPDPNTITFAPNTHDFITRILSAHDAKPVRIVASDGEFHSFRRQALRWAEDGAIDLTLVPTAPLETFSQRFIDGVAKAKPHLAFVSHVMFKSGLFFDRIDDLAALARPDGPWIVIDGYHSFMALPIDLSTVADRIFFLGGGYKYAMAGEGAAYLHAPPGYGLRPALTGWFAEFGALEGKQGAIGYAPGGMRFMGATFDATGLYRFNAVRRMLDAEALDTAAITARTSALRTALAARVTAGDAGRLREAAIIAPHDTPLQQRFLALRHPDATKLKSALMAHDIITDARDDVLRIGLGLYHDADDIDAFCARAKTALDP